MLGWSVFSYREYSFALVVNAVKKDKGVKSVQKRFIYKKRKKKGVSLLKRSVCQKGGLFHQQSKTQIKKL